MPRTGGALVRAEVIIAFAGQRLNRMRMSQVRVCGSLASRAAVLEPAKHVSVRTRSAEHTGLEAGQQADAGGAVGAIARIRLAPAASREIFEKQLRETSAVLAAWHVTGDVDYEALIRSRDLAALGVVLADLRRCCGGEVASAELVLSEVTGLSGTGAAA